jgi:hypothetical protein
VQPFRAMGDGQNKELKAELGIIDSMNIGHVEIVPSNWKGRQNVIGRLTNNPDQTAESTRLIVSCYAPDNESVDVSNLVTFD